MASTAPPAILIVDDDNFVRRFIRIALIDAGYVTLEAHVLTYRRVKFRVSALLGFKSFQHARRVLAGIELIQKVKKGQYGVPFSFGITSHEIWCHALAS